MSDSDKTQAADAIVNYVFIDDYCLNSDDVDNDYLELYGSQGSWGFRLASFKFTHDPCAELYLHCEVSINISATISLRLINKVSICNGEECDDLICTSGRKRRRRSTSADNSATLNSDSINVC